MRPRRAALAVAVPVAAALAAGSFLVTNGQHNDAQLAAASGKLTAAAAAKLPPLDLGRGVTGGDQDAAADLAATQDVAFSRPMAKPHPTTGHGLPLVKQAPNKIRDAAAAAMAGARSVHITGAVTENGDTVTLDLKLDQDSAEGTIDYPQGTMQVRRVGTDLYFQPDERLYASVGGKDDEIDHLRGKWLKVEQGDDVYPLLSPLTDLRTFAAALRSCGYSGRKGGPTLGGLPTVIVYGGHGGSAQSLYVATSGPAYPLYLATRDKSEHLAFYHWGQPVSVDEPSSDDILRIR